MRACACCDALTMEGEGASWAVCPACGWIDVPVVTGAEREELFVARRSFAGRDVDGAVSPRDEARARVEAMIEGAFVGVSAAGRVTMSEAYRRDFYGHGPSIEWDDGDRDWREIPAEVVEYFATRTGVFVFGNVEGFRYYLPAFMRYALRTRDGFGVVSALDKGSQAAARVAALDAGQRAAVVAFLRFVVEYDGGGEPAVRALRLWGG